MMMIEADFLFKVVFSTAKGGRKVTIKKRISLSKEEENWIFLIA
jgi:hypothetical protein